jgi:predicted O-methyltransferase YrrM
MYSSFQLARNYLSYYIFSSNGKGHGTHSPFVFDFITKVLNDKTPYPEYKTVEKLRASMLADPTVIPVEDFGAGSKSDVGRERSIRSIAKNASKQAKFGKLLFRMARHYRPASIVELGTSLGITSAYLAMGAPRAAVITMEGAPAVAAKAQQNFRTLHLDNITVVEGNFDDTLANVITGIQPPDLVFVDGNHRREPTERYFRQLMTKVHNDSIIIFDDIHWSPEMEKAWDHIRQDERVRCSIDLFFIGIVLFRQEFHEKQDFTIRF